MGDLLDNFLRSFNIETVASFTVSIVILWWLWGIVRIGEIKVNKAAGKAVRFTGSKIGRRIRQRELAYSRDNEIGLVKGKSNRHKIYVFLNDLTIDLGLKMKGCTPYELLFFLIVFSISLSIMLATALGSLAFGILSFPIVFFAVVCGIYTRANSSHAARIGAIIEAENIICNNISAGVKVAVRGSIQSFPKEVINEFKDYLNELDDNTHPVTALRHLNDKLGSISDSFIANCIQFEMQAESGTADTFQDIVEMNAYMTTVRVKMNRTFEQITNEFLMCVGVIGAFFVGVLAIYPYIRNIYFNTVFGNILLLIDLLLVVLYFVVITYNRAKSYFGD